jgi:GR25 family glycosyltransferase involved in LPS biosynthesis
MIPIRIWCTDFWGGFQNGDNIFINYFRKFGEFEVTVDSQDPQLLIYSVFGKNHQNYPRAKKFFYTGENIYPPISQVFYAWGFHHIPDTPNYTRFPIWLLYFNFFECQPEWRLADCYNPDLLFSSSTNSLNGRDRFCAAVVSNGQSLFRNQLFNDISAYKRVDSAGRWMRNVDDLDRMNKVEFLRKYKFTIACENSSTPGYLTEKLFEAKIAGTIPIYWGDTTATKQFNPKSFLCYHDFTSHAAFLEEIKRLDQDDEAWLEMSRQPIFVNNSFDFLEFFNSTFKQIKNQWLKEEMAIASSSLSREQHSLGIFDKMSVVNVDHMYCINMDMCWDRWERMSQRMRNVTTRNGDTLDRFSAVTWADPRIYRQKIQLATKRTGILGCTQSHRDLWERIVTNKLGWKLVLILEDDVFFQDDFVSILNQDLAELTHVAERGPFIYFVNGNGCDENIMNFQTHSCSTIPGLYSSSLETGPVYLTGGYVVNSEACRLLLSIADEAGLGIASDHITWRFQSRHGGPFSTSFSFFHWPWLAVQENEESYIQTEQHLQEQIQHNENECMIKHGHLYSEYRQLQPSSKKMKQKKTKTLTLVTMFYDLSKIEQNHHRRKKEEYLKWADFILSLDINLVIFTDPENEMYFYERRQHFGFPRGTKTLVCPRRFQQLHHVTRYLNVAQVNWKANIPYFSHKHTPEYCMMVLCKSTFVREIAELDPFQTSHFGWIDLGCDHINGVKHNLQQKWQRGERFTLLDKDVIFIPHINKVPSKLDDYSLKRSCYEMTDYVIGGFFTATRRAAIGLSAVVDEVARDLIINHRVCPTEEPVLTWIAILFPEMFWFYKTTFPTFLSDAIS